MSRATAAVIEPLENRLFLTITYNVPAGQTLDINPISFMRGAPFSGTFNRMEVGLTSVPGVSFGNIFRVSGTESYVWGTTAPNFFSPSASPGFNQNRISSGEGFRYVNNGGGIGQSETIPVRFVRKIGVNPEERVNDTLVINITSSVGVPQITQQPDPYEPLAPGEQHTLTVAATGLAPLSYQWFKGLSPNESQPIAGATSASLVVSGAATPTGNNDPDRYWVRVSNAVGSANSLTTTIATGIPPVALPGGPYDVPEGGGSVVLQGSSQQGAVVFNWDFNNDNLFGLFTTAYGDERGLTPTFNSLPDDDGPGPAYTVSLQVHNILDQSNTASTIVHVVNVAPTAGFRSDGGVASFTNAFDPSPADRAAGFTYSYDFNDDGVFDLAGSPSASAAVPAEFMAGYLAGARVRGRIADKDGGFRDYLASVNGRVLTVTTTDDNGGQRRSDVGAPMSLRSAIEIAEADAAPDQIVFDPSLYAAAAATINLSGATFSITTPVTLSGPTGNHGVAVAPANATSAFRAFNVAPSGDLTLERMIFRGFSGGSIGGAIYSQGRLTIRASTFNDNKAGRGGAIYNDGGVATIVNSTFWQNTATGQGGLGGAIFSRNGSVEVTHVTIAENTAAGGGRGLYLLSDGGGGASAVIRNSILGQADASVTDFAASAINGGPTPTSSGDHNLIRNGPAFGGQASNADPRLSSLFVDVGPTPTVALSTDSPAIDAASAIAGVDFDQRGIAHLGLPDIGSYEEAESLVVTTGVDEDDGTTDPRAGTGTSLREAVAYAERLPGPNTITFAPSLAGARVDLSIQNAPLPFSAALTTESDLTIQGFENGPTVTIGRAPGAPKMSLFYEQFGNLTLNDLVLADGDSPVRGGAVQQGFLNSYFTVLTVNRCTFINNHALIGGAIGAGNCFINDSTFVGNSANQGGAIAQFAHTSGADAGHITQSTFFDNRSATEGSAVLLLNGSIRQSTIVGNHVEQDGFVTGGAVAVSLINVVPVLLQNNLIADNTGGNGRQIALSPGGNALHAASRNNLIGVGDAGGLVDGVNGNRAGVVDPGVFDLADNGGPTQTVALRPGSPAINTAATLSGVTADQRGVARPQYFAPDIGAYEFNGYDAPVNDAPTFTLAGDPPTIGEDAGPRAEANFAQGVGAGPSDEAGQKLTFHVTQTGGGGLTFAKAPAINPLTGELTYQTNPDSYGTATFGVTLTDDGPSDFPNANTSATRHFTITVNPINDAPVVANPLADVTAVESLPFTFTAPTDVFLDVDVGDTLTYSATLADGSPLPDWLSFNPATRTFSGTPSAPGSVALRYIASDGGASVADEVEIQVQKRLMLTPPSSQIGLTGVAGQFNLGSFADADPLAGPWDVTVDWGDGSDPEALQVGANILKNPKSIEQSPWGTLRTTVRANLAEAPDGTVTADLISADGYGQHYVQQGLTKPAKSLRYVFSFYVKGAGLDSVSVYLGDDALNYAAGRFNLFTGATSRQNYGSGMTAESVTLTPVGNGWNLATLTATTTAAAKLRAFIFPGTDHSYTGEGINGVLVWNAALAQGAPADVGIRPHRYAAAGDYDVQLNIVNQKGDTDASGFKVKVKNLSATPPTDQSTLAGVSKPLNLGSFADPDPLGGPWTVTVDYGDGSAAESFTLGQNLLQNPQAINLAPWVRLRTGVTADAATAPDGSTTADLVSAVGYGQHYVQQGTNKPAQSLRYTFSFHVKGSGLNGASAYLGDDAGNFAAGRFDLSTGAATSQNYGSGMTVESATLTPVGDGWSLATLTATTTAASKLRAFIFPGTDYSFTGDGAAGVLLWNATLGQNPPADLGSRPHRYASPGRYVAKVTVSNRHGSSNQASFAVDAAYSSPTVTAPSDQSPLAGSAVPISLGSFTDPDPLGGPWTVTVDFGDGSSPESFVLGQNLLQNPQAIDLAPWVRLRTSVTADAATAPDGTTTADLVSAVGYGQHYVQQGTNKPAQSLRYTFSFYVKGAGLNGASAYLGDDAGNFAAGRFDLSTGAATSQNYGSGMTVESATLTPVGDGWSLATLTATTTAASKLRAFVFPGTDYSFTGDGAAGVLLWNATLGQNPPADLGSRLHRYASPGRYVAKVTVSNRHGSSNQASFAVDAAAPSALRVAQPTAAARGSFTPSTGRLAFQLDRLIEGDRNGLEQLIGEDQ